MFQVYFTIFRLYSTSGINPCAGRPSVAGISIVLMTPLLINWLMRRERVEVLMFKADSRILAGMGALCLL
jgi:hypothetical protein